MNRRIGITIVTTLLAVFGIGHVRAFVTHAQFGCAAASAQQGWDDGSAGASESDEVSTAPEKMKGPPPDVAGDWSGTLHDNDQGTHAFSMVVDQSPNVRMAKSCQGHGLAKSVLALSRVPSIARVQ